MGEVAALVAILGAVDRAVVVDPALGDVAARFYPPYADGAAGWFDVLVGLSDQYGNTPGIPSLAVALDELGAIEPTGAMPSRRLHALAVASRLLPELGPQGAARSGAIRALTHDTLAADELAAAELLGAVGSDEVYPHVTHFGDMIDHAVDRHLIPAATAQHATPPCTGDLVSVTVDGDTLLATQLRSGFCTDAVTVAQAAAFLDPANWPGCSELWCEMTPIGDHTQPGPRRFVEVISLSCPPAPDEWTLTTCLEFVTADTGDGGALLSYRKCGDPGLSDGQVVIDQGTISIQPDDAGGICVTTTKTVRFAQPIEGTGLAMVMCALGWGSLVEDVILGCALSGDPGDAQPWPGTTTVPDPDPLDNPMDDKDDDTTRGDDVTTDPTAGAPDLSPVIDEAITAAKECLDECAAAYKLSYQKAADGTYGTEALFQDATKAMNRMLTELGRIAEIAKKAAERMPSRESTTTVK